MSVEALTRLEQIQAELGTLGRVRVAELAEQLGVSEMTVRRDLDALAELGIAHRVRGGAVSIAPQSFAERFTQAARAKDAIAAKLVDLVEDGASIGLDASTTVQRLAAQLGEVRSVTAVTSSLESFAALGRHPGVTALLTGGTLDPRTGSLVGPLARRAAADVNVGWLFVSAAGCHPVHGTTEATLEEADVKRALAEVATTVVVAVDSSKLEQEGPARCLAAERIDLLVTELDPADPRLDPFRDLRHHLNLMIEREWVGLTSPSSHQAGHGSHPCQGLYHRAAGTRPRVACIATHYNVDFSEHYLAGPLAERGLGFLGWNTRYRGNEAFFTLEQALVDIGAGVRWLREAAGAEVVVVLGNSGGGSLMGAYQAQATDPHITATHDLRLPDAVLDLSPADLYISLNAHPGRPEVLTAWLDASVTDETDPLSRDAALDMFDPANGPPYAPAFVDRYRAAQVARNERITDWCLAELDRLAAGGTWDRVFTVPRQWADLRFLDLALDPSERSIGCYGGDPAWANASPFALAGAHTLRAWLSMWSLRTSQCTGAPHLGRITVPSLVVQSLADKGVFPSDAHAIHDALAADDLTLELIPGEHYFETGGRPEVADLITAWIGART